jgi:hypothetical protein
MNIYRLLKKWDWSSMNAIGTGSTCFERSRNKVSSLRDLGVRVEMLVRRLKPTVNKVSSLRDLDARVVIPVRRLKPTVNRVSSLRDFLQY